MLGPNAPHPQRFFTPPLPSSPLSKIPAHSAGDGEGRVGVITGECAHVTEEDSKRDR